MRITKKTVIAIASFVLLLLQAFGLKIDVPVVNEAISALAGVLVMLGIVSDGSGGTGAGENRDADADSAAPDSTAADGGDDGEEDADGGENAENTDKTQN